MDLDAFFNKVRRHSKIDGWLYFVEMFKSLFSLRQCVCVLKLGVHRDHSVIATCRGSFSTGVQMHYSQYPLVRAEAGVSQQRLPMRQILHTLT